MLINVWFPIFATEHWQISSSHSIPVFLTRSLTTPAKDSPGETACHICTPFRKRECSLLHEEGDVISHHLIDQPLISPKGVNQILTPTTMPVVIPKRKRHQPPFLFLEPFPEEFTRETAFLNRKRKKWRGPVRAFSESPRGFLLSTRTTGGP